MARMLAKAPVFDKPVPSEPVVIDNYATEPDDLLRSFVARRQIEADDAFKHNVELIAHAYECAVPLFEALGLKCKLTTTLAAHKESVTK